MVRTAVHPQDAPTIPDVPTARGVGADDVIHGGGEETKALIGHGGGSEVEEITVLKVHKDDNEGDVAVSTNADDATANFNDEAVANFSAGGDAGVDLVAGINNSGDACTSPSERTDMVTNANEHDNADKNQNGEDDSADGGHVGAGDDDDAAAVGRNGGCDGDDGGDDGGRGINGDDGNTKESKATIRKKRRWFGR